MANLSARVENTYAYWFSKVDEYCVHVGYQELADCARERMAISGTLDFSRVALSCYEKGLFALGRKLEEQSRLSAAKCTLEQFFQ